MQDRRRWTVARYPPIPVSHAGIALYIVIARKGWYPY
jgi:hypothetical protein